MTDTTDRPHNASTYTNYRCRCSICKAAHTASVKARRTVRAAMIAAGTADVEHGQNSTYLNWSCRCEPCRTAHADARRRYNNTGTSRAL